MTTKYKLKSQFILFEFEKNLILKNTFLTIIRLIQNWVTIN